MGKKGVALYLVLSILIIVVILANVFLNLVASQNRLITHQAKRVQAYYAAQAGVNFAMEQLRLGDPAWLTPTTSSATFRICSSQYSAVAAPASLCTGRNFTESFFPNSINYVEIVVGPLSAINNNRTINVTADYNTSG